MIWSPSLGKLKYSTTYFVLSQLKIDMNIWHYILSSSSLFVISKYVFFASTSFANSHVTYKIPCHPYIHSWVGTVLTIFHFLLIYLVCRLLRILVFNNFLNVIFIKIPFIALFSEVLWLRNLPPVFVMLTMSVLGHWTILKSKP